MTDRFEHSDDAWPREWPADNFEPHMPQAVFGERRSTFDDSGAEMGEWPADDAWPREWDANGIDSRGARGATPEARAAMRAFSGEGPSGGKRRRAAEDAERQPAEGRQLDPERQPEGERQRDARARGSRSRRASQNRQQQTSQSQEIASRLARIPVPLAIAAVALLAVILFAGNLCSQAASISVTVNGNSYTLRGDKNLGVAIKTSGLPVNPGDFISLKGNVIARSEGYPFYAKVNDVETTDSQYQLHDGDTITLTDGRDRVEEYDAVESSVPYTMRITSLGAIHTFSSGVDGVMETRTGRTTGEVVEKQTVAPQEAGENRVDPDTHGEKVIALTFDDGPTTYTKQIIEALSQNGAKATFFFKGALVADGGAEIAKQASDHGNQVCSHGYYSASKANGNMAALTYDEQRSEVTDGFATLANALGYEPSHMVRLGASDMPATVAVNVYDLIDAEIGWTIDTGDWIYMSEDSIYDVLMSVQPGSIVRMHDGGGDQSNTVAAVKRALPELAKQGYSFVTIDEMMKYVG